MMKCSTTLTQDGHGRTLIKAHTLSHTMDTGEVLSSSSCLVTCQGDPCYFLARTHTYTQSDTSKALLCLSPYTPYFFPIFPFFLALTCHSLISLLVLLPQILHAHLLWRYKAFVFDPFLNFFISCALTLNQ